MLEKQDFRTTPHGALLTDIYIFFRSHLPSPIDWPETCRSAADLADRYQDTDLKDFCNHMLSDALYELARMEKE